MFDELRKAASEYPYDVPRQHVAQLVDRLDMALLLDRPEPKMTAGVKRRVSDDWQDVVRRIQAELQAFLDRYPKVTSFQLCA